MYLVRGNSSGHKSGAKLISRYVWGRISFCGHVGSNPTLWLINDGRVCKWPKQSQTGMWRGMLRRFESSLFCLEQMDRWCIREFNQIEICSIGWNSISAHESWWKQTRWNSLSCCWFDSSTSFRGVADSPYESCRRVHTSIFWSKLWRIVAHWQSIRCEENHWNNGFTRQFTTWHINRKVVGSIPVYPL